MQRLHVRPEFLKGMITASAGLSDSPSPSLKFHGVPGLSLSNDVQQQLKHRYMETGRFEVPCPYVCYFGLRARDSVF